MCVYEFVCVATLSLCVQCVRVRRHPWAQRWQCSMQRGVGKAVLEAQAGWLMLVEIMLCQRFGGGGGCVVGESAQ